MENNEIEKDLEIEPVEIHPELYSANLFGEIPKVSPEEIVEPTESKSLPAAPFNIFALTDAIGARKKREAWVLYMKALASGLAPEEVFYKLVWQFKTMQLAQKTKSAEEADMKNFPYTKAKGFLKNFKEGELKQFSQELVLGYSAVRRGEGEMETLVEKTLLKL